ncbi:hypothetical protein Tco_1545989 [Tanacetum coccineum]
MKQDMAKQVARDEKLVPFNDRVKIGNNNLIIDPLLTQREETFQVALDILKNTPFYKAFLIFADVLEIYMQQFWLTIEKVKNSSSYQFGIDHKTCQIDVDIFRKILDISPKIFNTKLTTDSQRSEDVRSCPIQGSPKPSFITSCLNTSKSLRDKVHHTWITDEIKESEGYQMYFKYSTGLIPPKKSRGKAVKERELKHRQTSRKERTPRAIQEPPSVLMKQAQEPSGKLKGAGLRPEVPDEQTGKSADSDEGTGTSPEVPDESEDKSEPRDELDDWGSTDEEKYLLAYKGKKPEDISWKSTDEDESDNDDEDVSNDENNDDEDEDDMSIDIEKTDDERTDTDDEDTVVGKAEKILEQKDDEEHEADEEQKGDEKARGEEIVVHVSTPQKERPSLLQSTSSHSVSSNFVKCVVKRFTVLEQAVKELKQVDHSLAVLAPIRSQVPSVIENYLGTSLPEALKKVLESHTKELKKELFERKDYKDVIKESVQAHVINEVKNILPKFLPQAVKEALKKTPHSLGQSSSQGQSAIQGKKTKKRKFNESESSKKTSTAKESSKVFEKALDDVQQTFDDNMDTNDVPQADTDPKITKKDWFKDSSNLEVLDPDWNTVKTIDDTLEQLWLNEMVQAEKPPLTFDELMSTRIDFYAYALNHLKLDNITREILVGPVFNLLKGTCKSCAELEYNMEECFRALTNQLDRENPEGHKRPIDMSKPLPLQDKEGRLVIPVEFFFNNDLFFW